MDTKIRDIRAPAGGGERPSDRSDPYGEENRAMMKQIFVISVNEESRGKAIQAIRQEINYNYPDLPSTNEIINPQQLSDSLSLLIRQYA